MIKASWVLVNSRYNWVDNQEQPSKYSACTICVGGGRAHAHMRSHVQGIRNWKSEQTKCLLFPCLFLHVFLFQRLKDSGLVSKFFISLYFVSSSSLFKPYRKTIVAACCLLSIHIETQQLPQPKPERQSHAIVYLWLEALGSCLVETTPWKNLIDVYLNLTTQIIG